MNFLAHLYLSDDSDQIMLGNFIADFTKGKDTASYEREIYLGILLHREIDSFTDQHRQVARSKQLLWPRHRHYSSVIVDIFYDHFLAKNWDEYSIIPLEKFAQHVYTTLQHSLKMLPEKAQQVLPYMMANNWLVNYRKLEGINRAMQGMARRASFPSEMAGAVEDLETDYEKYEDDFKKFFPELTTHSRAYLKKITDKDFSD